ncbi:MAG: tRNA epoxyqueuosine(34) reductase QueG [Gemmatimonadota bacterium]
MRKDSDAGGLRDRIREAALEMGFAQIGFAPCARPPDADAYLRWLACGRHGEMGYMAREDAVRRRLDPGEALPGCRTIVIVSLAHDPSPSSGSSGTGPVVARYARGRDYHDVFEEMLEGLRQRIDAVAPGETSRPYVDYGPVLERDHARRAGLGWIGKNTMLLHPGLGSYFLLGELLTTLELPPDPPFEAEHCGTCERCIVACPTGAIVGPGELDARLCISYLTIELRGSIPVELRPLIGDRVFGCDICQEVCPWNRDLAPLPSDRLTPGKPALPSSMREWATRLLDMDDGEFAVAYRGTALRRPGRAGLLRNLCVGLGNSGDSRAGDVLRRCLSDPSPLVREHAEWALDRLGEPAGAS